MRTSLAGIVLVLALVAAGCGGGGSSPNTTTTNGGGNGNGEASKSAAQVLADAAKAASAATSLRLSGQVNAGAQKIGLDLSIASCKGATGSITLKGAKVDIVVIGSKGYMKGGADFWTRYVGQSSSALVSLLAGKWIAFPTTTPQFAGFTAFTNTQGLFAKLRKAGGKVTSNGATTFKGQSVVSINGGPSNGTLYVANSGTPYPVALIKTGGGAGEIDFSDWGATVTLTAPSGAVNFSKLAGG